MKINLKYLEFELELTYNEKGYLETVYNNKTNKYMMLESKMNGIGFDIKKEKFIINNGEGSVCDARYIRIIDIDIFIPKFIFIPNVKLI